MAAVVYVPNATEYLRLTRSPSGLVGRHLMSLGRHLERAAKRDVGVKTGKLRSSINSQLSVSATGLVMVVGSSHRIALMHHEGTRKHVIMARHANLLKFSMNGKMVYTKKVNHPGTRANPYLTKNLRIIIETS